MAEAIFEMHNLTGYDRSLRGDELHVECVAIVGWAVGGINEVCFVPEVFAGGEDVAVQV